MKKYCNKHKDTSDKWLGHMVRIKAGIKGYDDGRGEVVAVVMEKGRKQYIVQFVNTWCWYKGSDLKMAE